VIENYGEERFALPGRPDARGLHIRQIRSRPAADLLPPRWSLTGRDCPWDSYRGGHRLQRQTLGSADSLHRRRRHEHDNNQVENLIRPIALGRKNWLFDGRLGTGQRAAAVMSVTHTAKLTGHDSYRYLKDLIERLPMKRTTGSKGCRLSAGV
jgi:transposase